MVVGEAVKAARRAGSGGRHSRVRGNNVTKCALGESREHVLPGAATAPGYLGKPILERGNPMGRYLMDRQGSVRDIEDKAGTSLLDHIDYDGYGNVTSESSVTNGDRYKYTARGFNSETGLQYN